MDTIPITAATPKIMPSMVSSERNLWLHNSRKPVLIGACSQARFNFHLADPWQESQVSPELPNH